eukprot:gene5113-5353_t
MGNCFTTPETVKVAPATTHGDQKPAFPAVDKGQTLTNSLLGKDTAQDVTEFYDIGKILGAGQFGTTRLAVHKASGKHFACKSILKSRLSTMPNMSAAVRKELQIMHHVAGHPNVVNLKEAYEDHLYVHLIMELCTGGDLVERIMAKGQYTEKDAAKVTRKMLKVVAFCHEMGVMHRDLKPDNFLLADPAEEAELKAADFGLSCFIKPGEELKDVCGTVYYIAPEMLLQSGYDEKADVWAIGVILYILLCGHPPFEAVEDDDVFRLIVENGKPDFSHYVWDGISGPAKDAVQQMMTYEPKQRPTAAQMLQHEWVREGGVAGDNIIVPEVLNRLRSFASLNKLKKLAMLMIAQRLPADEVAGLKELFASMDLDGDGTITVQELSTVLATKGAKLPQEEIEQLMALADLNGNKSLDYLEFVGAAMHVHKLQQEEYLIDVFKTLDEDNSGFISKEELEHALENNSDKLSNQKMQQDIAHILLECDINKDGRIDYAEFVSMMLPKDELSQCKAATFAAHYAQQRKQQQPQNAVIRADADGVLDQAVPEGLP